MSREWQISNLKNVVRKEIWEINEEWQIRNLKNVGWKEIWEVNEEWQIRNWKMWWRKNSICTVFFLNVTDQRFYWALILISNEEA